MNEVQLAILVAGTVVITLLLVFAFVAVVALGVKNVRVQARKGDAEVKLNAQNK
jgi:hypothetical protein